MEIHHERWYAALYLIASNIVILPFVFRSFYYRRYDNAFLALGMFFMSTFYHIAQTGLFIVESLEYAQNGDHQWVTLLYWNVTLRLLQFNGLERAGIMAAVLWLITAFTAHLVQTSSFFVLYAVSLPLLFLYQFVIRGKKIPRYGLLWFVLGLIVGAPALVFFFFNKGVNTPNYWWAHGSWHIFILLSLNVIDLGNDYHNDKMWAAFDKADDIIAWQH